MAKNSSSVLRGGHVGYNRLQRIGMQQVITVLFAWMAALTALVFSAEARGQPASVSDTTEAAKVAQWVRDLPPVSNAKNHFSAISIVDMAALGPTGTSEVRNNGPESFYQNTSAVNSAKQDITRNLDTLGPILQAGGINVARNVQNFPWGMIETSKGNYQFSIADTIVSKLQTYGIDYVGTVMPYASWDLASKGAAASTCTHFFSEDFPYLTKAGKMDRYVDLSAFIAQLNALVERYDGDGTADMSGLTQPLAYWQIHNEPEGADCGGFRNDVASFFELMKQSHTTIKATCPSCQVMNGGAGLTDTTKQGGTFWRDFGLLGGGNYLDIIAVHYNEGKHEPATDTVELFEQRIAALKQWLGDKPVWVTEFGVVIGQDGQQLGNFTAKTETDAAAWFIRYYAAGLAQGVKRFFSDRQSFVNVSGTNSGYLRYLPYYVNRMMESLLGGFSSATKLASGQYSFVVGGRNVYVLSSGVPSGLTGQVTAYDKYGNASVADASNLAPSNSNPLIVVPVTAPVCTLGASPSSIAVGASATLTATCTPAATSYIWTGGTCAGTSASSCTASPTTTTTYTVTGVNTGGSSQAASVTVTVTAATNATSYTVPGTLGNDFFVLTAGNYYYGGGGNDTYIISPNTLRKDVTAKIVDTEGDNVIQLVDGMTVAASTFYADAAQLTLSNGAKVQILGASKFKFQVGANAASGDTAALASYADFVTSLGASLTSGTLPASGTAGYVVPTAFTQASTPAPSVASSTSTVPGTLDDDVLVPSGGSNNYLGGGGNDTYLISPYTLSGTVTAKIIDTEGSNVIQLVGGLTIASSSFFSNAVQLTLSNGAIVQILGAANFNYQLAADAPAGQTASSQSYAQFAATLGASVPTGTSAVSGSTNFVVQATTSGTATAPTGVAVTAVLPQTVGTRSIASSTRLQVNWVAPTAGTVNHYRVDARESIGSSAVSTTALSSATGAEIGDLKAGTPYAITVTACNDSACASGRESSIVNATTSEEYWQLQGSGNTFAGLTPIVSDGNARISATRFGNDANGVSAGHIQLYYGPRLSSTAPRPSLSVATSVAAVDASNPASYTASFTSLAGSSGLMTPESSSTRIKGIATGQGVPLSTNMGGKVRLFFEAEGPDGKTRIYSIDSVDGWVGRDFNADSSSICATAAAYENGGTCTPTLLIGVEGDTENSNAKVSNARQHKVGFPSLTDWRWDGAAGTFMVFTIDKTTGCTTGNANHGYAVWDGTRWSVQYEASGGCPKMFKSAQAALPMHIGGVRYKMYYADTTTADATRPAGTTLPFLGPKVLIYGDGTRSGQADRVDFEDWEVQSSARNVNFLWPNGDLLDASAEGFIDDYHFLTPTGNLAQQVMYMAITDGKEVPMGAAALLLNP